MHHLLFVFSQPHQVVTPKQKGGEPTVLFSKGMWEKDAFVSKEQQEMSFPPP